MSINDTSMPNTAALAEALHRTLRAHVPPQEEVCVALSGGRDSLSLLHASLAFREQWQISACNVVDTYSEQTAAWAVLCKQWCDRHDVPCYIQDNHIVSYKSEAWSRNLRLKEFSQLNAKYLLIAHHQADQAETILFRFLRGASTHSLAAMRECTQIAGKTVLRPWLAFNRNVITAYAKQHRLRWVEDHDNRNLSRRRNFLRWQVLPLLESGFPKTGLTMAAAAKRMQESSGLLLQLADIDDEAARRVDDNESGGCVSYHLNYFHQVGAARTRNWVYRHLHHHRLNVSEHYIAEVARQLLSTRKTTPLQFNFGAVCLHLWRGLLYWQKTASVLETAADAQIQIPAKVGVFPLPSFGGELILEKTMGMGLSPKKINDVLTVRVRKSGERIAPSGRPTRYVSKLLQEHEIPPWRRNRLPLLFSQEQLVAIPSIACDKHYTAAKNEAGLNCHFKWHD